MMVRVTVKASGVIIKSSLIVWLDVIHRDTRLLYDDARKRLKAGKVIETVNYTIASAGAREDSARV